MKNFKILAVILLIIVAVNQTQAQDKPWVIGIGWNVIDDNKFGYVDEKMSIVNSLPQEWTSVIQMIRMFHFNIQRKMFEVFSDETNESIKLEMYDRGWVARDF